MGRCETKNWEEQLNKRFERRIVCCPDYVEHLVQLLLFLNLPDEVTIVHVCRKLLFDADHGDIGVLKYLGCRVIDLPSCEKPSGGRYTEMLGLDISELPCLVDVPKQEGAIVVKVANVP